MGLKEKHRFADSPLLLPRLPDGGDPLGPDPRHLGQELRLIVDNPKRLRTESTHDPPRHLGAYPFHHAGPEVRLDAFDARGEQRNAFDNLELPAVSWMRLPVALQAHSLPRARSGQVSRCGDRLRGAVP